MKIYALICHKLVLTQFWPKVVSWRFEITTDEVGRDGVDRSVLFSYSRFVVDTPLDLKNTTS